MNDLTRAELLELLEEEQDRGGPDLAPLLREIERRNRFAYMLKMHHEIECENDQKYRQFLSCQQGA